LKALKRGANEPLRLRRGQLSAAGTERF